MGGPGLAGNGPFPFPLSLPERLQEVLVLQRKPQERIGALAIEVKFAAHAGTVVFDCSVVDGKLGADFFAGFSL